MTSMCVNVNCIDAVCGCSMWVRVQHMGEVSGLM